jgi:hypothetical protein
LRRPGVLRRSRRTFHAERAAARSAPFCDIALDVGALIASSRGIIVSCVGGEDKTKFERIAQDRTIFERSDAPAFKMRCPGCGEVRMIEFDVAMQRWCCQVCSWEWSFRRL